MNDIGRTGVTFLGIGAIMIFAGMVIPFFGVVCLLGLLLLFIGFILIVVGLAQGETPSYPQYPGQYPQQYPPQPPPPPQYAQPRRWCPSCGREIDFNAIACQYCGYNFKQR
ncbi:MAG: hypothetical protein JSV09_11185 [Thermoplasmata archaeon]|nr:MAG: hypothetical protein JSV09_11185 [Thermoplasmata archaeon]